jgi:hypothetical protein
MDKRLETKTTIHLVNDDNSTNNNKSNNINSTRKQQSDLISYKSTSIITSSTSHNYYTNNYVMNYKFRKGFLHHYHYQSNQASTIIARKSIQAKAAPLRDLLDNGESKHNQYEKFDAYIISENANENTNSSLSNNLTTPAWLLKDDKKLEEKATKQKEIHDNFKSKRSVQNRRLPITSSQSTPNFIVQQQHS